MPDRQSIGIIGTGWVGSSVAISTLHLGIAQELLLHDVRAGLAEGEAMDLAHGASFYPAASVRGASIDEMRGASVVVISAGKNGALGFNNVALSLPAIVGLDGAVEVLEPELDEAERAALSRSAGILRSVIEAVA